MGTGWKRTKFLVLLVYECLSSQEWPKLRHLEEYAYRKGCQVSNDSNQLLLMSLLTVPKIFRDTIGSGWIEGRLNGQSHSYIKEAATFLGGGVAKRRAPYNQFKVYLQGGVPNGLPS